MLRGYGDTWRRSVRSLPRCYPGAKCGGTPGACSAVGGAARVLYCHALATSRAPARAATGTGKVYGAPMRITIDYTSAIAQSAGIGRYTRSLVAALASVDRGDQFALYTSEAPGAAMEVPSAPRMRMYAARVGRHALGNRAMTVLWHRARVPLPVEVFAGRSDVFHAPDFSLAPTLWGRRVVTIHDLAYRLLPECALPSLVRYLDRVVPRAVRAADRVIAVSRRTADDLVTQLGVPAHKVSVIHLGVDAAFRPRPAPDARAALDARYGLCHPLVLAVGTIEPRKNYARLIEAFVLASQRAEGPRMLAIAGRDGWLYEAVYAAIARRGVADAVRMLGYVPEAELPLLYNAADVVAVPALYEGFGIPVLEAMASGIPVLCSHAGALPEVAGDAALLVAPKDTAALADGLARLTADVNLRQTLRRRGLARASMFTWEAAARAHVALYHGAGNA